MSGRLDSDATGPRPEDRNRLREQGRALLALARSRTAQAGDLAGAVREIAEAAAATLACERVSVWFYDADRSAIRCLDLYEATPERHSAGAELSAADFPAYFTALETERAIAAHDAGSDPRTREFRDSYLAPLGITSMLDVPIRRVGAMVGVVCHEHVGPPRRWTAEEESFAASIGDLVALAAEEAERVRTERALRGAEERYRTIVESALEGIWWIDAEGRTTYTNPRMAVMLGYSVEELLGKDAFDLVAPEDMEHALARWDVRRQGTAERRLEFRLLHRDGSRVWVSSSAAPAFDDEGRFVGAVAMMMEISEHKRAEAEREELLARERAARAQAEAANRTKDEFLAIVSHELRTPLNAIVSWTHLLRSGRSDPTTLERGLATIERNVRAQAQLIDDIFDVSRIIRGTLALNPGPVDLAAVLHQAVESARPAAAAKGVSLVSDIAPSAPMTGDPGRLQQIAWNLLSNALKFTPAGGRVEVRLAREDGRLRLAVTDTGQGIRPEFLPYVFDRFRQADGSTTRAQGGLGLGLAIVRHLAELHGGSVEVESLGEGLGARFTVTLPEAAGRPAGRSGPPLGAGEAIVVGNGASIAGLRILVVEDDADTREALGALLAQAGALPELAGSVAEALASWRREPPDLLLADIGMPGEDGYDLLRRLGELEPRPERRPPAVALTAYARLADREKALAAGFQAHLAKPVQPADLFAVLASLRPAGAPAPG